MDTSETYIKMCEKAQSCLAQSGFSKLPFEIGNVVYCPTKKSTYFWTGKETPHKNDFTLPRQDQLQEMVQFGGGIPNQLWNFKDFCFAKDNGYNFDDYTLSFNSMEQLWLIFVMKEKYDKVWNGEDWVKKY